MLVSYANNERWSQQQVHLQMLSKKAVMTNIYQGFLLAAIKFVANVRALSLGKHCRKYTNFFFRE